MELVDFLFDLSIDDVEDVGSSKELLLQKCTNVLAK